MNLAFETRHDGTCVIENAEGLDVTAEELARAYEVIKDTVDEEVSVAPAGIINPNDVHALTLKQIGDTFPAVRHDDIHELASVVEVPVSTELEPVVKETFCDALSTLGKWNIQERPDSLSQQREAQELIQDHEWQ